jgi:uncharacterized OB-fold protein
MPGCPFCGSTETTWVDVGVSGRLYSWITVRHAFSDEWSNDIPYSIATVELDVGVRILGRLDGIDEPTIDMPLQAHFVHHSGWSEVRFGEPSV